MELEYSFTPYKKRNSKCIKDLNVRPDTIRLRGKHRTLFDINSSNIFSEPSAKVMEIKAKLNKWVLIKLKTFCIAKETIKKTKRQPTEWEKIIANDETDKGLVSKIYQQLMWLNIKITNNPIKKRVQDLNRHSSKEDILGGQKAHEKMLNIPNY